MANYLTQQQLRDRFGHFSYSEALGGRILIDQDWLRAHIVTATIPFLANGHVVNRVVSCHKLIAKSLVGVFDDLNAAGKLAIVRTFDGCWVARHMRWDVHAPLSAHAWGVAFDTDATWFPYDSDKQRDPEFITIVHAHGFSNGQEWSEGHRDPMHSEYTWQAPS